ncbi:DcaP family trimeric outer membrane transporter [Halomonas cibimaris]|uniref:DcaP family trimeric outer membrane transporter n=1 Tax=Halomonas cibimaris TaxID=657012 RepID=A0ABP7LCH7_9GAMM
MTKDFRFTRITLPAGLVALCLGTPAAAVDFTVGDTQASIYGFAKLDMIYDTDNDLGDLAARPRILIDGQQGSDGHLTMHPYQSRLGFKTQTPVDGSALVTRFEVDWMKNPPEGGDLRLRHAYGSWNGVLAGKTWTNFGSRLSRTPIIDFAPSPGQSKSGRKAQLRYSMGNVHIALENPDPDDFKDSVAAGFNADRGVYKADADARQSMPDVSLRYQAAGERLAYSAAAVGRRLSVDSDSVDDSAMGWGVSTAARFKASQALTLRGVVTYGDGIGEYLQNNPSAPAFVDGSSVETISAWGANLGASLAVGPGAVNLGYGISRADLDDVRSAGLAGAEGANKQFEAVHLNYIWSPASHISYGMETSYHTREVADGRDGDALRLQGMVRYAF